MDRGSQTKWNQLAQATAPAVSEAWPQRVPRGDGKGGAAHSLEGDTRSSEATGGLGGGGKCKVLCVLIGDAFKANLS